jgi:hypothetical protein
MQQTPGVRVLGPHLRTPKLRVTPGSTPRIYYIGNRGGLTRNNSEFRRPEMWALYSCASFNIDPPYYACSFRQKILITRTVLYILLLID